MITASEAQIAAGVKAYNATPNMPHRHREAVKNAIEAAERVKATPVSGSFEPIPRICPPCLEADGVHIGMRALKTPYIVVLCRKHGGAR